MRILLKIAAALVVVLATNAYLSRNFMRISGSEFDLRVLDAAIYDAPVSTLFVGDSHIGVVILDAFSDDSYLLSSAGQCFIRSYYRLATFLEEADDKVDTIVVSVSLHSFRNTVSQAPVLTEEPWPNYIRYNELEEVFSGVPDTKWGRMRSSFIPYAGNFERYILHSERTKAIGLAADALPIEKGRTEFSGTKKDWAKSRVQATFRKGPEPISEGYLVYLKRIIALAEVERARIVLVTMPITEHYWDYVQDYVPVDEFFATLERLPVPYLDHHDLYFDQPELFADSDHLSPDGALQFTQRLKEDMAKL